MIILFLSAARESCFIVANSIHLGQPISITREIWNFKSFPRLPVPGLWLDVFQKIRSLGYTGVSFYVNWALLEGDPGTFRAEGVFDLDPFFEAATQAGIYLLAVSDIFSAMNWAQSTNDVATWSICQCWDIRRWLSGMAAASSRKASDSGPWLLECNKSVSYNDWNTRVMNNCLSI